MVNVFSFTLFGSEDKYCKGLLRNVALVEEFFSGWEVWVYCGDGIPEDILLELHDHTCVKLIPTGQTGMINKFYRFFAIDDPSVETCLIRDTDSRLYERDRACIQEFLQSPRLIHIIRDHPNHHHTMMAGMWGIKGDARSYLGMPIQELFHVWKEQHPSSKFWSDTQFLCEVIYPLVLTVAMIHDETQEFEHPVRKQPFPYPLVESHFIGQVYEFSSTGQEIQKFSYSV
jgi:hypothetical protein